MWSMHDFPAVNPGYMVYRWYTWVKDKIHDIHELISKCSVSWVQDNEKKFRYIIYHDLLKYCLTVDEFAELEKLFATTYRKI